MAILRIYKFPEIVLAKQAEAVERVDSELRKLADSMLETMYDAPGVGLAANQVGILQRIFVLDTEFEYDEDQDIIVNRKPQIMINPEIIYREGEILFKEACLSVPEYSAEVKRAEKVKLQYQDVDGLLKILDAEGLMAVAIQHELDHLDGRLFIDRLSPIKKEMIKKKLIRQAQEDEPEHPPGRKKMKGI